MSKIRKADAVKPCGTRAGFREVPPFPRVDVTVGARVRLDWQRRLWDVIAVTDHFAILSRQAAFKKKGELFYTIIDWRNGVYGPANTLGQAYPIDDSVELAQLCVDLEDAAREVSYRNRVQIQSVEVV